MNIKKQIGKALQKQRKMKGFTQERFSEILGISTNYLSAVERGINQLSYEILVKAINVLQCSADDIFAEVIDHGMTVKACALDERLNALVPAEKARILVVLETLIETAEKK